MAKKPQKGSAQIAGNKRAYHDYFIEEKIEAGVELQGWEVKSLREGRGQLSEAYVQIKNGEVYMIGSRITPLLSASTHIYADDTRTRKLLLHRREIDRLMGAVDQKGYTIVPLSLYWKRGMVKVEIGLAKGKKDHDKRATIKERDWNREKQRLLRHEHR
ncbi:SsrA-binding protein SmpB [Ignatzschineria cameli]|uniref:SsrA-binding protein n=1 Tax=Ignatzschineria cameli TaxID=2182793 RepID=A0A2U2AKG5_9GAMM|nr:SsrA-binding protein SmpB [Ignatzschineria cameli]PWD83441.1 SsrA-binding protein [Ignatzschineria cameli]PWD88422.1 SsrA-binding protein [Ignatzschineria cameli]PWD88968.1 SsrA-binding protein [Ignatzschineria cameli]PWD89660.1 SsrA-binding protein [Ignatzschineria cameli]